MFAVFFGLEEECRNTKRAVSSSYRDDDDHIEVNSLIDVLQLGTTSL